MMSTHDFTGRGQRPPPPSLDHWPVDSQPIDAWLRDGLSRTYDPVLGEDLPEELLAILIRPLH